MGSKLIFEELPIGHCRKLVAQLDIVGVTAVIALAIKAFVLGFVEFASQVIFRLEESGLSTVELPALFDFAARKMRVSPICVRFFVVGSSPRIQLALVPAFVDDCFSFYFHAFVPAFV